MIKASGCILLLLAFFSSVAESAFVDKGGVRPLGMAGAYVALADDASAIIFNPAGLGQIERTELSAAYDRLYAGLSDDNLGRGSISYVHPSQNYGAFALNLTMLNTPLYRESAITLGYGRFMKVSYLGLNAKLLFAGFEENDYTRIDPLFNNGMSVDGMALDLGILHKFSDNISFGLAALNINQPNIALDEAAKVPLVIQTGMAFRLGSIVPTMDLTYRNRKLGDKRDINLHLGIESWLKDKDIALRAGVNFYDMALGASYVISLGKNVDAQLDYAFRYPLVFKEDTISDTYGSHLFSLDIRFGAEPGNQPARNAKIEEDVQPEVPLSVEEMIKRATDYRREGKSEEGIKLCDDILKMQSEDAVEKHTEALLLMGGMLSDMGRHEEAIARLQEAVKIAPQDPKAHYELGVSYKKYGESTGNKSWYNKAIIEFEKAKMIDPELKEASIELSGLYERK